MEISDYITVLKNGEVTGNVRPDEVDEAALASLMVGREVILTAQKAVSYTHLDVYKRQVDGGAASLREGGGAAVGLHDVPFPGAADLVEAAFQMEMCIRDRLWV